MEPFVASWAIPFNVIGEDPLLSDPINGDYSLQPGSPAAGYGCYTFPEREKMPLLPDKIQNYNFITLFDRRLEVEGEISENTIWDADTVTVVGDLAINNDVILEIAPGTIVEFAGFYSISVEGTIIAEGDPEDRILFHSSSSQLYQPDTTMEGSWNGISFINTASTNQLSVFTYCVFENSKSLTEDRLGGVISCYNFSKLNVTNCIFRNNLAFFGSVFGCNYNSAPVVTGNLFYNNDAITAGSPFYIKYSHPVINYNTITSNNIQNEDEWYVTGIIHTYIAKPQLTGNIIRDNFTNYYFGDQILEGKAFYLNYNNIENWEGGTGNIDLPAQFLMQEANPYYLDRSSPCINAGINQLPWNNPLPVTDLAGEVRIYDDIIDMGAYEWQGTSAEDDIIPSGNLTLTNYPNPFNPETIIRFQVPDVWVPEDMGLCIYNIKGQKVRTYSVNQKNSTVTLSGVERSTDLNDIPNSKPFDSVRIGSETAQGKRIRESRSKSNQYSITWNGTDNNGHPVPSGIYFCKLKFGSRTASRKMILLK